MADTLTSLTNQQSRPNYPTYRRLGLPITSSHIESIVKQISRRVKGGEALLQLRANQLCDTASLDSFWLRRTDQANGTRNYKRSTKISA